MAEKTEAPAPPPDRLANLEAAILDHARRLNVLEGKPAAGSSKPARQEPGKGFTVLSPEEAAKREAAEKAEEAKAKK